MNHLQQFFALFVSPFVLLIMKIRFEHFEKGLQRLILVRSRNGTQAEDHRNESNFAALATTNKSKSI